MKNTAGKILLIEDEESLSSIVALNLELEGYEVTKIENGREAIHFVHQLSAYDLVILDVMLPEVTGWDICSTYKRANNIPILFISAKGTSSDRIKGLRLGADDYLGKPFDLEELLLRVQILVARKETENKTEESLIFIGDFTVNLTTYEVRKAEQLIASLTKRDVQLLELFKDHEGEVLSREVILEKLWGENSSITTRTIDNYILGFRKLFEQDAKSPVYFHSIRGVGYKFTNNN